MSAQSNAVTAATASEIAMLTLKLAETYLLSPLWSPAPKLWAIGMPKPPVQPLQKPRIRKITDEPAPTAARAFTPTKWPTSTASIRLYPC